MTHRALFKFIFTYIYIVTNISVAASFALTCFTLTHIYHTHVAAWIDTSLPSQCHHLQHSFQSLALYFAVKAAQLVSLQYSVFNSV